MSSPNLNNVIILGCILSYSSVILFAFDGDYLTADLCKVCRLLSPLQYSSEFLATKDTFYSLTNGVSTSALLQYTGVMSQRYMHND